ncbi:MAG: NAD(P)(+) transhydrogenase (Re/Si-specific) subunit alpha [Rickettsiales bacterium]|nr:NAD(P)(+) transhydrogenase (Re/Si-specific) subunit alpha [Rickettsiales bacterium]
MKIGVPREVVAGERRVAVTPETVQSLRGLGFEVIVEAGAGVGARFTDDAYLAAGATVIDDTRALWSGTDIIIKVRPPAQNEAMGCHESDLLPHEGRLISLLFPGQNEEVVARLAERKATVLALDCIPRISRAQKMDVLSSMSNIAGYRAVIEASHHFGSFFGGQITAAGRTRPARVLIIGAGVAGLSAIAAARGLGAEVRAFDTRAAAREQVQSLGAKFLEVDFEEAGEGAGGYGKQMSKEFIEAEMRLFAEQCAEVDIVITTALIPNKQAPILITQEMVESMRPGSVIVDLAAERGGNCEATVPDQTVEVSNVTIIGYTDLTSRLATHASQFFGNNVVHLLDDMCGDEGFYVDLEDEAVRGALVLHVGEMMWPPPPIVPKAPPPAPAPPPVVAPADPVLPAVDEPDTGAGLGRSLGGLALALSFAAIGATADAAFIQHFTVFVLSCFVGWQLIWNVTPALHTPLMAVTNAISGIIIVGGIIQGAATETNLSVILGVVAILVASINVFGGFLVTQRMLKMFRK